MKPIELAGAILLALLCSVFLVGLTATSVKDMVYEDAVQNGVGEYYVTETGKVSFRWKPAPLMPRVEEQE